MIEEQILLTIMGLVAATLIRSKPTPYHNVAEVAGISLCILICYLLNRYLPNYITVSTAYYGKFMLIGYFPTRLLNWSKSWYYSRKQECY